ncbi:DUF2937 family protein [Nitratireductor sp. GISD-1A_MAKvit]|uniref:DUF2937 family protein n=1 Tax=Nitratireductor sp. GISD-1A_MAKvit TaxID=3234198 RepID=UPI0034657CFB
MFGLGRILGIAVAVLSGLVTSQAPEFAQQYRQRLNGALDELTRVVEAFDADAAANDLSREQAFFAYERTGDAFFQDRVNSVRKAIGRLEDLERQSLAFDASPPVLRPVVVVRSPDPSTLQGALEDYEPAVPLTPAGWLWAGAGPLFGFSLLWLIRFFFRPQDRYSTRNFRM